jgi:hypothetical protein
MAFAFYTERRLIELCGLRARTLPELLVHLREVSGSVIFYHTHERYLTHHFRKPVFYNDFAEWTSRALQEEVVAEKLAAIDMLEFTSIRELREAIIATIEEHLRTNGGRSRECPAGDEFHFCRAKSFVMPTGVVAEDLPDFTEKLLHVTNASIFYHFFEARLRLGRKTNDFSQWLSDLGERRLAEAIDRLDPYIMTLNELKQQIRVLCRRRLAQR